MNELSLVNRLTKTFIYNISVSINTLTSINPISPTNKCARHANERMKNTLENSIHSSNKFYFFRIQLPPDSSSDVCVLVAPQRFHLRMWMNFQHVFGVASISSIPKIAHF